MAPRTCYLNEFREFPKGQRRPALSPNYCMHPTNGPIVWSHFENCRCFMRASSPCHSALVCRTRTLSRKFWTGLRVGTKERNESPNNVRKFLKSKISFRSLISWSVWPAFTATNVCTETPIKVPIQKMWNGTWKTGEAMLTNQLGTSGEKRRNRK